MINPVRIQRRRSAGYDMQAVSRATNGLACASVTRPGRFGNPYDVGKFGRPLSMELFRNTVNGIWSPSPLEASSDEVCDAAYGAHHAFLKRLKGHPLEIARSELRGKNLACYCDLAVACHADVWLEVAQD